MRAKDIVIKWRNSFSSTLMESLMIPEVQTALTDWAKNTNTDDYLMIGGAVVGYYSKPRMTQDVDVLFKDKLSMPQNVLGFKQHRPHAFEHRKTGVEIKTLDSQHINILENLVDQVFANSVVKDGVRIPNPDGLVALKVCRHNLQDIADIDAITQIHDIDLTGWDLDENKIKFVEDRLGYSLRRKS